MGIFADIKTIKEVNRIKSGGTAKLSLSQITSLITNMPDAKKNLSSEEFNAVYTLFKEFRKNNTKIEMDMNGYLNTAEKIIKRFDVIAPYEKYGGGNELEFSFMMEDMRSVPDTEISIDKNNLEEIVFNNEDKKYMNQIVEQSAGQLNLDDAQNMLRIIYHYHDYGKNAALNEFDILARKLIEDRDLYAVGTVSFMSGLLYPNGILTKEETDNLSKKYTDIALEKLNNKSDK